MYNQRMLYECMHITTAHGCTASIYSVIPSVWRSFGKGEIISSLPPSLPHCVSLPPPPPSSFQSNCGASFLFVRLPYMYILPMYVRTFGVFKETKYRNFCVLYKIDVHVTTLSCLFRSYIYSVRSISNTCTLYNFIRRYIFTIFIAYYILVFVYIV